MTDDMSNVFIFEECMVKRAKATIVTPGSNVPAERQNLGQQVVTRILELIRTGNLRPGDRLPPERKMIEIFRISRPSLREALRSLSILGVIESHHGGGAYVTDLEARRLLAPLDFYLSLSRSNLVDTFESRRLIEVEITRKAATRATPEDIRELRAMVDAHMAVLEDPIGFRILDSQFHEKLSLIAGNAILQRIADGLYNMGLDVRRRATADPAIIAQSTQDHTRIVDAIAAGDAQRAAAAMKRHLAHIEESTRRFEALMGSADRPILGGNLSAGVPDVAPRRRGKAPRGSSTSKAKLASR